MRVLLITRLDDEREIYGTGLTALGYSVSAALPEETAIGQVRADVIVLDVEQSDDWGLAESLSRTRCDVPVVVLTAAVRPDRANRDRAKALKCAAFLGKPCSHVDLARVLALVLEGQRGIEFTSGDSARTL